MVIYGIVYKATNLCNNSCYIGQTTKSLDKRKARHLLISKNRQESYFYRALIKYGFENFKWEILKECETREELNLMEINMIATHNSYWLNGGYNLTFGGEGTIGYKHSEEAKQKMRKPKTKEHKQKLREINLGKHCSDETKDKMSQAMLGEKHPMFGKHQTKEWIQKRSIKLKENNRKVSNVN